MDTKTLTETLSVSGQITTEDVSTLKQAGIKSIICNRPDNEDAGQPAYDTIATAAAAEGLAVKFMPVVSGQVTPENGVAFGQIIDALPKPIHAYCRSGTRCTTLWALSELNAGVDPNKIIEQAAKAGYDLSKVIG